MLKKFNKIFENFILNEEANNIFKDPKEIFEKIVQNDYESFKNFREDKVFIKKIKLSGKKLIKDTADYIWSELEKLDNTKNEDKEKYDFLNQLFYFLKELC